MKSNDLVVNSPAKSRKRKWIRFERLHLNAMWHTDWHMMKDLRMKSLNLITYLDGSSRYVTGAALFKEATSENAAIALHQAVSMFGVPVAILSDNDSCFVSRGNRKKRTGIWTPTLFEKTCHQRSIVESVFSSLKCRFTASCSRKEDGNTKIAAAPQVHLLQPAVIVKRHKKYVLCV